MVVLFIHFTMELNVKKSNLIDISKSKYISFLCISFPNFVLQTLIYYASISLWQSPVTQLIRVVEKERCVRECFCETFSSRIKYSATL